MSFTDGGYYPLRRLPHAVPKVRLWSRLLPLSVPVARSAAATALAALVPGEGPLAQRATEHARQVGDRAAQEIQHTFFAEPGLDTLTVRVLSRVGSGMTRAARLYLTTQVLLGRDPTGRRRRSLRLLPDLGYDALMMAGLAAGGALGYFKLDHFNDKSVRSYLWWDSADPARWVRRDLPPGHTYPQVRRFDPPRTLADTAADIDDMYWANAYGQPIKITRVGEGEQRRWIVALPGTDHGVTAQPNPADLAANMAEELNLPSTYRLGVIQTIKSAMAMEGLDAAQMVGERVLIAGHSQGGIIGVALAAADPEEVGFTVDRVLTFGSPTRRFRLRPDVMLAGVEHAQDIIPALDGTPGRDPDQRVTFRRKLVPTRRGPLFYAHSSATYTETTRRLEREAAVTQWGEPTRVVEGLQAYLPRPGEDTRVFHFYTWQDLEEDVGTQSEWEEHLEVDPAYRWRPVSYDGQVTVGAAPWPLPLGDVGPENEGESDE